MTLSIDSARKRQSHQLKLGCVTTLTPEHDAANLACSDPGKAVETNYNGLAREIRPRNMRTKRSRIDVDGMTTRRFDDLDSGGQ